MLQTTQFTYRTGLDTCDARVYVCVCVCVFVCYILQSALESEQEVKNV